MAGIAFGADGKVTFPTKYHGSVTLSKNKWDEICSEPERYYYPLNGEKIPTTLINPDVVRHHKHEPTQFMYYKRFSTIMIAPTISTTFNDGVYFAVVIDENRKRICTVYPVVKPKDGKEFKPA
ncbi:MAG TPA: hypothetical protein VL486_07370 [Verrucomicrobiae bacterium]|nr:hypothetical protein [Verrucomicrobiae bacterium]